MPCIECSTPVTLFVRLASACCKTDCARWSGIATIAGATAAFDNLNTPYAVPVQPTRASRLNHTEIWLSILEKSLCATPPFTSSNKFRLSNLQ
jgi:hypothetical protein